MVGQGQGGMAGRVGAPTKNDYSEFGSRLNVEHASIKRCKRIGRARAQAALKARALTSRQRKRGNGSYLINVKLTFAKFGKPLGIDF